MPLPRLSDAQLRDIALNHTRFRLEWLPKAGAAPGPMMPCLDDTHVANDYMGARNTNNRKLRAVAGVNDTSQDVVSNSAPSTVGTDNAIVVDDDSDIAETELDADTDSDISETDLQLLLTLATVGPASTSYATSVGGSQQSMARADADR